MTDWLDDAFRGPAWHGPALLSSLRGVTARQAVRRPRRGRHNIAEIVVHAAYWKHIVRLRLTGARERFPLRGRNWFTRDDPDRWADDRQLLIDEHRRLRTAVARLGKRQMQRRVHARQTALEHVRGIAAHDVYHAGQIQLLKRLLVSGR